MLCGILVAGSVIEVLLDSERQEKQENNTKDNNRTVEPAF